MKDLLKRLVAKVRREPVASVATVSGAFKSAIAAALALHVISPDVGASLLATETAAAAYAAKLVRSIVTPTA